MNVWYSHRIVSRFSFPFFVLCCRKSRNRLTATVAEAALGALGLSDGDNVDGEAVELQMPLVCLRSFHCMLVEKNLRRGA